MKNLLLLSCFMLTAAFSYSQLQVVASGEVRALNPIFSVGGNASTEIVGAFIGRDRSGDGRSEFSLIADASNFSDWGTRLFRSGTTGAAGFQHRGTGAMTFQALDAANLLFRTNDVNRMVIRHTTGNVEITGSATVNGGMAVTSDKRLKSNINAFDRGLETVLQMNPVSYRYTAQSGSTEDRSFVGVVAQELQKIAPEFVSDHVLDNFDGEGNILSSETYLKVHDSEIKYLLVNAIKDQQELIDAQNERIAKLEEVINTIGSTEELINRSEVTLTSYDLAELNQNRPNPFNSATAIDYVVPTNAQNSEIVIFGLNGQVIKNVSIDHVGKGTLTVNASDLTSGTYTYQLVVDGKTVETNKMVVTK